MEPETSQNQTPVSSQDPSAYKSPNLAGYTSLGHGTIKESLAVKPGKKATSLLTLLLIFIIFLSVFLYILGQFLPGGQEKEITIKTVVKKEEPESAFKKILTPTSKKYTNLENRYSIIHPSEATEGGSAPDPFPVSLELRYNEPAVEFKIGEERPGWYLRISERLKNEKGFGLYEFAVENKLISGESVTAETLAGAPAIKWRSPVFPQTFYLLDTGEGFFLIKYSINSEFQGKHLETINSVLASLRFLQKSADPDVGLKWVRKQFGSTWDIEYPEGWRVDEAGLSEGGLYISGTAKEVSYGIRFSYPVFEKPAVSLLEWVNGQLSPLTDAQKQSLKILDVKIGAAEAKEVVGLPTATASEDRLYVWRRLGKNPSLITLGVVSGEPSLEDREALFFRIVKGIR